VAEWHSEAWISLRPRIIQIHRSVNTKSHG
jgi:hypothetical protein